MNTATRPSEPNLCRGYGTASFETAFPLQAEKYPELRYMGSKQRLLKWIHAVLSDLDFESAYDPFSGSGCVSYLLKSMGRRVVSSDFLNFPTVFAKAMIENNSHRLKPSDTSLVTQTIQCSIGLESK